MTPEGSLWTHVPTGARALSAMKDRLAGFRGHWSVLLVGVWVATLAAMLLGAAVDQPILAVVPMAVAAVLVAIAKAPLRYTLLALTFLALVLENPAERPGNGQWKSPLYIIGALLLANLNTTLPIKALRFSGIDVLTGLLFLVWLRRRVLGRHEVTPDMPETARPLRKASLISFGTVLFLIAWGLATRGDFTNALWQTQKLIYVPIIFALMSATFRGPRDHALIGGLVVGAATLKACVAMYVRALLGPEPPYVTTHADSMLFAIAFCIPLIRLLIAADRKSFQLCLLVWPLLIGGMIANGRRLVWVEVSIVAVIVLLMTPWTPVKRALVRVLVLALPLMPVYMAVGWNSNSAIFKPVKTFRSITDSNTDRSSATRDIENYNLVHTLKLHSFVPMGFGHEYHEMVMADDISQFFPQYRFIPHNSVLGLWAFAGVLGFTGIWMMLGVAVFFAARSYRMTRNVDHQTAALSCIGAIFIYLMQAYGDMGLVNWIGVFLVTPAMVVAGKLAVATGAFPSTRPLPVAPAAPAPALAPPTPPTPVPSLGPEAVTLGPETVTIP